MRIAALSRKGVDVGDTRTAQWAHGCGRRPRADGSIMSSVADFEQSGECFAELLSAVSHAQWEEPAVDGWTVRGLAGHATRAILTVEYYLAHDEPGGVGVASAEEYYARVYPSFVDPAVVHTDGISAGLWLADDAAERVSDALARTRSLMGAQPSGRAISIGGMGILLSEYLRTRVVELVLHTMDLAHAVGIEHPPPFSAVNESMRLVTAVAPLLHHGEERLLHPLPSVPVQPAGAVPAA